MEALSTGVRVRRELSALLVTFLASMTTLFALTDLPTVCTVVGLTLWFPFSLVAIAAAMRLARDVRFDESVTPRNVRIVVAFMVLAQLSALFALNPVGRVIDHTHWPTGGVTTQTPPALLTLGGYRVYEPPGRDAGADVPADLVGAMHAGGERLESLHLERDKCGGSGDGWKRCMGDYLLAAVNTAGDLQTVELYEGSPSSPPGFTVEVEGGAMAQGVNVPFQVTSPKGWTVVALRTGVYSSQDANGLVGAVYVPYSTKMDTPSVRHAGLTYLIQLITQAEKELDDQGVQSLYFPGKRVTEIGTPEHILTLILTEQMQNEVGFVKGDDGLRLAMLNRTLAIIGANGSGSYRYARSSVGAAGIGQLMPKTYRNLRRDYPAADLPEDTLGGRVDHESAIKAMILHADNEWWAFTNDRTHRSWLIQHPGLEHLVLAAGYNANVQTVDDAIHACGDTWRSEECGLLPAETRHYLVKYEWVYDLLFHDTMGDKSKATE